MNLVNERKEFFAVSLDEIETVLVGRGYKVEIVTTAEAQAYRQTATLRNRGVDPFLSGATPPRFHVEVPAQTESDGIRVGN